MEVNTKWKSPIEPEKIFRKDTLAPMVWEHLVALNALRTHATFDSLSLDLTTGPDVKKIPFHNRIDLL